ncbi:MAG: putative maoC protein dehydratase [Magnetococcales bacterium]|nr:putative maoC protein dehydratase [Magnetococcales bacterium]
MVPPVSRCFDMKSHEDFICLSMDKNPLHADPQAARRLLFGRQVVHGIHGMLWALDRLPEDTAGGFPKISELKCEFTGSIHIDDHVALNWVEGNQSGYKGSLLVEGRVVTRLVVETDSGMRSEGPKIPGPPPEPLVCREVLAEDLAGCSGKVPIGFSMDLARKLFPRLVDNLSCARFASLLSATRLVGMECPGLHSIFSGLKVAFHEWDELLSPQMVYQVVSWQPNTGLIRIKIQSPQVQGTLECFHRPAPKLQPTMSEIVPRVKPEEFAGQHALVVGGSRGLGELTAKILGAGGAQVTITYHTPVCGTCQ